MKFVLAALAMAGAGLLGAGGFCLDHLLGQARYGRGKNETLQTLFSRNTL